MIAPEVDDEVRALKIQAVLDHVLSKIPPATRSVMPMLQPRVTAEFLEIYAGALLVVSIPLWWLQDGGDWLLPSLEAHP